MTPRTSLACASRALTHTQAAAAAALEERGLQRLSVHAVADAFSKRALRCVLDALPALAASAAWLPDDVLHVSWDAASAASLGLATGCVAGGEAFVFASTGAASSSSLHRMHARSLPQTLRRCAQAWLRCGGSRARKTRRCYACSRPLHGDVA